MLSRMLGSRRIVASWLSALAMGSLAAQEPDGDWGALLADAQKQLQKGQLSSAESAFEELAAELEAEPAASRPQAVVDAVQVGLWTIALAKGRYESVRDAILAAAERLRSQRSVVLLLAQAHRRVGAYGSAAKLYETLVAADPKDLEARHELGEALWSDGLRVAARAVFEENAKAEAAGAMLAFRGRSKYRLGARANLEAASRDPRRRAGGRPEVRPARITLGLVRVRCLRRSRWVPERREGPEGGARGTPVTSRRRCWRCTGSAARTWPSTAARPNASSNACSNATTAASRP
jgi:tetratricopeptide (TPR) repeat protein